MIAMKSATENAGDLIDGLQLAYNKLVKRHYTRVVGDCWWGFCCLEY